MWVKHLRHSTCAGGGAHRTIGSCELSLQRLRASAPVVEYIAPAPAVVAALRCAGEPLEDHSPTQASFKTQSRKFWGSFCHDTHVKTQCCGSHPAAPLLTDTRWLTVGPGTREDLVAATAPVVTYIAPASAVSMSPAPFGGIGRGVDPGLVSGFVHIRVARMTRLGSG